MIICHRSVFGSESISDMTWPINITVHSSTHLRAGKSGKGRKLSL
ncbi:hypothetical protein FOIG_16804 [Fusarium odoratissimum NRRL 54006]|uniref:Uncharacterized protein n=1 Tax=Fusarium odoratissimum (strain NRRL 54006) TaxID=1089451 RepID=X0JYH9_FUSO5|nr:uncharacterized protein FOIG_16804 [Fusarium odoratissimum NRRL 54006]EXL89914.1 hypothetical protein FOIG_16804 [Fusarium odoratissimum NRRL 54006]